jgi:uncharacterized protein YigE (DUF2233 family)
MSRRAILLCVFALLLPARLHADAPALVTSVFRGHAFWVRTVDPKTEDLRLYWSDDQGGLLRDFSGLENFVHSKGEHLLFAANAGMFQPDSKPVGLLVLDGVEKSPLNLGDGYGNFYLKPNGVFVINIKHEARVVESSTYPVLLTPTAWATQSGPLLVYGGDILPDFIEDSKNKKVRSGVGIRRDGTVVFALSKGVVNFYDLALFFNDVLKCPNALYLDGDISAFHVPGQPEKPGEHSFGPMFGLIAH